MSFKSLPVYRDYDVAVVGLVEERLDLAPVLASFEVSVAASASFVLACLPPCRDQIGLLWQDLPRHGYGLASSLPTWQRLLNLEVLTVHNPHVVLAWTGPCFLETPAKNVV